LRLVHYHSEKILHLKFMAALGFLVLITQNVFIWLLEEAHEMGMSSDNNRYMLLTTSGKT
jgi:hypothetical protein